MNQGYDMYRPIVMLCGLPGTGKTTLANLLVLYLSDRTNGDSLSRYPEYFRVSFDDFKNSVAAEKGCKYNSRYHRKEAHDAFVAAYALRLDHGEGVILDDTFKSRQDRRVIYNVAKQLERDLVLLELICSHDESVRRIKTDASRDPGYSSDGFLPTRDGRVLTSSGLRWQAINKFDFRNGRKTDYFCDTLHHFTYNTEKKMICHQGHHCSCSTSKPLYHFMRDVGAAVGVESFR